MSIGVYSWVHDTATIPYEYKKTFYIMDENGKLMLATNYDYIFHYFTQYLLDDKDYSLIRHSLRPENDDELMVLILRSKCQHLWPNVPAVDIYRQGAKKVAYVDWRMEFAVEAAMSKQMRFLTPWINLTTGRVSSTYMGVPLERIE